MESQIQVILVGEAGIHPKRLLIQQNRKNIMKNIRYIFGVILMVLPMTMQAAVVGPGPKPVKKAVVKPKPVKKAVIKPGPSPVRKAVKPGPSPVKRAIR